jgi:hypothetical protein
MILLFLLPGSAETVTCFGARFLSLHFGHNIATTPDDLAEINKGRGKALKFGFASRYCDHMSLTELCQSASLATCFCYGIITP